MAQHVARVWLTYKGIWSKSDLWFLGLLQISAALWMWGLRSFLISKTHILVEKTHFLRMRRVFLFFFFLISCSFHWTLIIKKNLINKKKKLWWIPTNFFILFLSVLSGPILCITHLFYYLDDFCLNSKYFNPPSLLAIRKFLPKRLQSNALWWVEQISPF